jgi:hypothetical protein
MVLVVVDLVKVSLVLRLISWHLSCDGYCRGGADRIVREIVWIILNSHRVERAQVH